MSLLWRIFSSKIERSVVSSSLKLSCSYLEVHSGMSLGIYYEAPCNVLHDAPDEALEMNVESDELLEIF